MGGGGVVGGGSDDGLLGGCRVRREYNHTIAFGCRRVFCRHYYNHVLNPVMSISSKDVQSDYRFQKKTKRGQKEKPSFGQVRTRKDHGTVQYDALLRGPMSVSHHANFILLLSPKYTKRLRLERERPGGDYPGPGRTVLLTEGSGRRAELHSHIFPCICCRCCCCCCCNLWAGPPPPRTVDDGATNPPPLTSPLLPKVALTVACDRDGCVLSTRCVGVGVTTTGDVVPLPLLLLLLLMLSVAVPVVSGKKETLLFDDAVAAEVVGTAEAVETAVAGGNLPAMLPTPLLPPLPHPAPAAPTVPLLSQALSPLPPPNSVPPVTYCSLSCSSVPPMCAVATSEGGVPAISTAPAVGAAVRFSPHTTGRGEGG